MRILGIIIFVKLGPPNLQHPQKTLPYRECLVFAMFLCVLVSHHTQLPIHRDGVNGSGSGITFPQRNRLFWNILGMGQTGNEDRAGLDSVCREWELGDMGKR